MSPAVGVRSIVFFRPPFFYPLELERGIAEHGRDARRLVLLGCGFARWVLLSAQHRDWRIGLNQALDGAGRYSGAGQTEQCRHGEQGDEAEGPDITVGNVWQDTARRNVLGPRQGRKTLHLETRTTLAPSPAPRPRRSARGSADQRAGDVGEAAAESKQRRKREQVAVARFVASPPNPPLSIVSRRLCR